MKLPRRRQDVKEMGPKAATAVIGLLTALIALANQIVTVILKR